MGMKSPFDTKYLREVRPAPHGNGRHYLFRFSDMSGLSVIPELISINEWEVCPITWDKNGDYALSDVNIGRHLTAGEVNAMLLAESFQ